MTNAARKRIGASAVGAFDNGGRPSANRIHERWQNLRGGDRIASDAAAGGRRSVGYERSRHRSGARLMPRWTTRLHAWVYRRSGGRVLGRMGSQPVLLLQTTGRRSGRTRTTPVQYLADGDTFVVVASNAGAARPPAWYLNLRANPHAQIDVGGRSIDVRAQEAAGQERAALWRRLTTANPYLERAARKARRDLPLMALVAAAPTGPRPATGRS